MWHSAITLAAGTDGNALSDQQLTKNGVPIIVDSCIAFVTQYGEWQHNKNSKKVPPVRENTLDKKKITYFLRTCESWYLGFYMMNQCRQCKQHCSLQSNAAG